MKINFDMSKYNMSSKWGFSRLLCKAEIWRFNITVGYDILCFEPIRITIEEEDARELFGIFNLTIAPYPLYAFIEIIILWLAILLTIITFYKISKSAAYLLLPYIFWVSFASILNFSILILNL